MQKSPTCDRLPEAIANIGHDFNAAGWSAATIYLDLNMFLSLLSFFPTDIMLFSSGNCMEFGLHGNSNQ